MYPLLPCRDIDEAITFYEALGFERTYRQVRPNPSAVVEREGMGIHLFGIDGFNPADSYGSVIIQVTDPDALYQSFATGLRTHFGKLPTAGIPRILRPRKRQGTVYGFTLVDVGGNWLRIFRLGDTEEKAADEDTSTGLARVISNAARQGDAHGDHAAAIRLIGNGLAKYPDAPAVERVRALLYRAELACRLPDADLARASLAEARGVELGDDAAEVAPDFASADQLVEEL
jgi:catechol 2,3-dioxygenase-like lactoylglutathione lyase family enzyme